MVRVGGGREGEGGKAPLLLLLLLLLHLILILPLWSLLFLSPLDHAALHDEDGTVVVRRQVSVKRKASKEV